MRHGAEVDRPLVFLSFAGDDQKDAMSFGEGLARAGIDAFLYNQSIQPGENFVLAINRALARADYYTLLLSRASIDSWWVEQEWSAALTRERHESRLFLFVVRLDETPPPLLLATRRYLDAFAGRDAEVAVVQELASTFHEDWAARGNGAHTRPAPPQGPTLTLSVRNHDLSVGLVLAVPERSTGRELESRVRAELALRDDSKMEIAGRTVGLRFHYRLECDGKPVPPDDDPLVDIEDGATVHLVIRKEELLPTGRSRSVTYRGGSRSALPPGVVAQLMDAAFGHLLPRRTPR